MNRTVFVVCDERNQIVSVAHPVDVSTQPSGIVCTGVILDPGKTLHVVDLPAEVANASLLDIHLGFKLEQRMDKAVLVRSEGSKQD